jgi:hypothetical protein
MTTLRVVWAFSALVALTVPVMSGTEDSAVRAVLESLPESTTLAANLLREGKWYALGGRHILSLCRAREREPMSVPTNMTVHLVPLPHRIVLWSKDEHGLVIDDIVHCDDAMNLILSERNASYYVLVGSVEHKPLLAMIRSIKRGEESEVLRAEISSGTGLLGSPMRSEVKTQSSLPVEGRELGD